MSSPAAGAPLATAGLVATALIWGAMIPMTFMLATVYFDPFFVSAIRYLIPAHLLVLMDFMVDRASPFSGPVPVLAVFRLGGGMACFSIFYTVGIMLYDRSEEHKSELKSLMRT